MTLAAALAIVVAGFATAVSGQAKRMSDDGHREFEAIGRVNIAGLRSRQICTGTLIAPDLVLTAAHCVFAYSAEAPHPADEIHFVAGWLRGEMAGHSVGRRVVLPRDWRPDSGSDLQRIAKDVALLELASPITSVAPVPLNGGAIPATSKIVGYRWDRPHALTDYGECSRTSLRHGVSALSCRVTFGTSGAPVLVSSAAGWSVAGIASAISGDATLAVNVTPDDFLGEAGLPSPKPFQ